jgi:putative ATPase
VAPLALRMRPRTLEEFAGQKHILGEGKLLRRMLQADAITSIILHGPPGTGKTTLAELIAAHTKRHFERENAASVGVKRIREIIDDASRRLESQKRRTILFLDEIHRFTRAQQDVLLGDVERGLITLIGATTENPIFAVNSALVSRSTLFRLELLTEEDIMQVLRQAIADPERGYGGLNLQVSDEALAVWATKCDGDARRALTALEVAVLSSQVARAPDAGEGGGTPQGAAEPIVIDRAAAEDSIQQKAAVYDDDEHYDVASALIKAIRGSDPDAAVYWIARMLEGGEDPRFIARRLAILASEDIGNADPRAIMVAAAAWQLVERIGMPEARITLAQAATYLSLAPKSNASYVAIDEALEDVRGGRTIPVPMYLRDPNSPPPGESPGRQRGMPGTPGQGYVYSHSVPGAITEQDYLGVPKQYYRPGEAGLERSFAERLEQIRRLRDQKP